MMIVIITSKLVYKCVLWLLLWPWIVATALENAESQNDSDAIPEIEDWHDLPSRQKQHPSSSQQCYLSFVIRHYYAIGMHFVPAILFGVWIDGFYCYFSLVWRLTFAIALQSMQTKNEHELHSQMHVGILLGEYIPAESTLPVDVTFTVTVSSMGQCKHIHIQMPGIIKYRVESSEHGK